jgi:tetratricopeptide (TPR) repeat protein
MTMPSDGRRDTARWFFERGYELQAANRLDDAVRCYQRSLELYPIAETHTFLGWAYSILGRYEEAIRECERAIRLDPEFGNPYNDIGAYLIQLGRPTDAIPWLEQAAAAKRYASRCFPYVNLGRVYERLGRWHQAQAAYTEALRLSPDFPVARTAIVRLRALAN